MVGNVNPENGGIADAIRSAYRSAASLWRGCDSPSRSGGAGLNPQGLSSTQAIILARATSGAESAGWRAAARWLKQIEEVARMAMQEAEQAVELAEAGQFEAALAHASRAAALEATYRPPVVWRPFVDALEAVVLAHKPSPSKGE